MPYATEDEVFALLGADTMRPARVQVDGKGGVTQATYDSFSLRYERSIQAEIRKAGLVPPPAEAPVDTLLASAHAHMMAGAIKRRFSSNQAGYESDFASGNIFLRQYISDQQLTLGRQMGAPSFVVDTTEEEFSLSGFPVMD